MYPLNFFITYLPLACYLAFPNNPLLQKDYGFFVVGLCLNWNGILNVLTYVFVLNGIHKLAPSHQLSDDGEDDHLGITSWHVGFSTDVQVIHVDADTREVNIAAEAEAEAIRSQNPLSFDMLWQETLVEAELETEERLRQVDRAQRREQRREQERKAKSDAAKQRVLGIMSIHAP